ncbi:MAG: hypothetical protein Q9218_007000 [Villophora microphyllina]
MSCERRVLRLPCGHDEELELRCTSGNDPGEQQNRDWQYGQRAYHAPAPGTRNELYRRGADEENDDNNTPRPVNGGQVPGAADTDRQDDGHDDSGEGSSTTAAAAAATPPGSILDVANTSWTCPRAPMATLREQADHPDLFRARPQYHYQPAPRQHFPVQQPYPPQQQPQQYYPAEQGQQQHLMQQQYPMQQNPHPPNLYREDAFYGSPAPGHGSGPQDSYGNGGWMPSHADWYQYGDEDKENSNPEQDSGLYYE